MKRVLPDTAGLGDDGRLVIGGCDTTDLAKRFGTPLLVVCKETIATRAQGFARALGADHVFYAAKAFCCIALCQMMADLGLGIDVCSGGELATAIAADFPPERIILHGNNKSENELRAAHDAGVGRIVVDSFDELDRIESLGLRNRLLIRVTPGVEAHTHEFVQTGQEDSKFGFGLGDGSAAKALRRALDVDGCELVGVHAHIGSQIFELAAFDLAVARIADFLAGARAELGFTCAELNLGGGLGIAHTEDEVTPDPEAAMRRLQAVVADAFAARSLPLPEVFAEPGRSLVGSSTVTLYRVGTVKRIPGVRTYVSVDGGMSEDKDHKGTQTDRVYVSVDGGMSDNPRYALYGAEYQAYLANRMNAEATLWTTVVGKHCESGDILIRDVRLPEGVAPGDVLVIPATGAYTYSMASNYNRVSRPSVVMVHEGEAHEIVRRETYEDLLQFDLPLAPGRPVDA